MTAGVALLLWIWQIADETPHGRLEMRRNKNFSWYLLLVLQLHLDDLTAEQHGKLCIIRTTSGTKQGA